MSHSPLLAPSSAAQWAYCAASPTMTLQHGLPDKPEDTADGTAAHWVCSETLLSFKDNSESVRLPHSFVGEIAPNGVVITEEMADGAQM